MEAAVFLSYAGRREPSEGLFVLRRIRCCSLITPAFDTVAFLKLHFLPRQLSSLRYEGSPFLDFCFSRLRAHSRRCEIPFLSPHAVGEAVPLRTSSCSLLRLPGFLSFHDILYNANKPSREPCRSFRLVTYLGRQYKCQDVGRCSTGQQANHVLCHSRSTSVRHR